MQKTFKFAIAALAATALTACGSGDSASTGGGAIRVVGSSTVYPFSTVVSETFTRNFPDFAAPLIESNGTGSGIGLFCEGAGPDTPSIANASRRMKAEEFETCVANGVTNVTEIQVGLDGIAFAAANGGIQMNLTPEIVYRALAASPFGEEQTAKNWNDIDPSLPNLPILVYGPPSTSGTRDALKELVLEVGCKTNPEMAALKESDEDRYLQVCTEVRSDGAFVDQGEQDNLIVQKIEGNANAVGVFGYSYMEENLDRVHGLPMNGVEPIYENIANFTYPGARPLFIYVKKDHVDAIAGLREFLTTWAESWGREGPLAAIGLVASPDDVMARSASAVNDLPALTAADFE